MYIKSSSDNTSNGDATRFILELLDDEKELDANEARIDVGDVLGDAPLLRFLS